MSTRQSPRRNSPSPRRSRLALRTASAPALVEIPPPGIVSRNYSPFLGAIVITLAAVLGGILMLRSQSLLLAARYASPLVPLCMSSVIHRTQAMLVEYGCSSYSADLFALQAVHYCSVSSPALATQMLRDGIRQAFGAPSLVHPILEALLSNRHSLNEEILLYIKTALLMCSFNATNQPLGEGLAPLAAAYLLRVRAMTPEGRARALELAALLLGAGAKPNVQQADQTPLLHSCLQFCRGLQNDDPFDEAEPKEDFVALLLDSTSLDVNELDADRRTPLFFACNSSLIRQLVERGADPNAVSLLGETPLEYHLRLLHDDAQEAGAIAALAASGARLSEKPMLLSALVLHDNALSVPLSVWSVSSYLTIYRAALQDIVVDFATRELHLPFLRLLDVSGEPATLCLGPRDVLFYTKEQVAPVRSVLDGVLEITVVNGSRHSLLHSTRRIPEILSDDKSVLRSGVIEVPVRDLDRIFLRYLRKECITLQARHRAA